MSNFNENNPTVNWTEDEKYEVCKWENKWLKELTKNRAGAKRKTGRVCDSVDDPTFATTEELNTIFQIEIANRKQTWEFLCTVCDFATNTKQSLTSHLIVHGVGEQFKCDQCNKHFSRKETLKKHIQVQHEASIKLQCQICPQEFPNKALLKSHMQIHEAKTIPCDKCSKMFVTVSRLKYHQKTVHGLTLFKCQQCNKRFKTVSYLNSHKRSIHDKDEFNCNLCDYIACRMGDLKTHTETVHEEKKNWFCQGCPYSCYSKAQFISHMRIHTGEKPFQCNKCFIRYPRLQSLQKHKVNCTS